MILNAYAVLDGFVALLRLGLGLTVLGLGLAAVLAWVRAPDGAVRAGIEDRYHLLVQGAGLLLVLNVASWPLFYLLLQSYVPQWPGVMCIYGVTRVGDGSLGPARFLPPLVAAVQVAKPAVVFVSGGWLVLHLVNRGTRTGPLTGWVLLALTAAGLLAAVDAAAELAYIAIPKQEEFHSSGCCTGVFDTADRFLPTALAGVGEGWLTAAFYATTGATLAVLWAAGRWYSPGRAVPLLLPVLVAAAVSLVVGAAFLVDVAAPRLIRLPYHHCPYDLVPRAPEGLVAAALFLGGAFAAGWAGVADWAARAPETRPAAAVVVRGLLRLSFHGYLGAAVMLSVELTLAYWA
jgi:hypothetical protein